MCRHRSWEGVVEQVKCPAQVKSVTDALRGRPAVPFHAWLGAAVEEGPSPARSIAVTIFYVDLESADLVGPADGSESGVADQLLGHLPGAVLKPRMGLVGRTRCWSIWNSPRG